MRRRVLIGAVVVVVLVAAGVAARVLWTGEHRSDFSRALDVVPAQAKRMSFTDWSAIRQQLDVPTTGDPDPRAVARWVSRAYNHDLTSGSSMDDSARALQEHLGFSPGNADWETYAQADKGSAMVLRMDDAVDFDDLASTLTRAGFHQPDSATGVWRGGPALVVGLDPSLTPEVQYVVLLADQHLVVTSDQASYAATAARVAAGDGDSLGGVATAADMVGHLSEPAAAVLWANDFACSDLAMSQADSGDQSRAKQVIAQAGTVSPLSGLVMALSPGGLLTVAEEFDSGDQANENLRARARLAVGEAVGRGESTFSDDFHLIGSRTDGATVLLTMKPRRDNDFPLSSLYDGPVIFATC